MYRRKSVENLFVLDTNILLYHLNYLTTYSKEHQGIRYLIPIQVIKELEINTKNSNALIALNCIKQLEEINVAEILFENLDPTLVVPYWRNDLIDFHIIAYAHKYNATLLTTDKFMFFFAISVSVETVYLNCFENNIGEEIGYKSFEENIELHLTSATYKNLIFYNVFSSSEILLDTSFLLKNKDLVLEHLKFGEKFCVSIQTLIEVKSLNSLKEKYVTEVYDLLNQYIYLNQLDIVMNKSMPSSINEDVSDNILDLNCIIAAKENDLVLFTSDITMYSLAKKWGIREVYLDNNSKKVELSVSNKIKEYDEEYENQFFHYNEKLKLDDKKYLDILKGKNSLEFVKRIYKEYIFEGENLVVFSDYKKRFSNAKKHKYPHNILKNNDFIVVRERYNQGSYYKFRQIIYRIQDIEAQIFVKISDSFFPNQLYDDRKFMKNIIFSLNNMGVES